MGILRETGRFIGRWANYAMIMQLQRLPVFRNRKGVAIYDPLLDPEAVRSMRLGRVAREADWPPRPRPTPGKRPAAPADTQTQAD